MQDDVVRKIAVIFVTDVVGFSKKMERNEDQTLKSFKSCKNILETLFDEHGGRIFNTAGDSILAEFQSAVSAVICATEFQKMIKQRNGIVEEASQMTFRLGINMGDVIVEGSNLYGDGVNVAARLEALSQAGGVCLSKSIHDFVQQKVDLTFEDLGKRKIKETEVFAYDVLVEGLEKREKKNDKEGKKNQDEKLVSIAVLPFQNQSNDPDQDYFVDGITEDIINNLSLWRTFPVTSSNSSFMYKNKSINVKDVGNELGVRYVVQGSVRKGGQKVRITAQLIDCAEDHQLWSEKWDKNVEDIFDVQDEVSAAIAAQVAPTLNIYESERVEKTRPNNLNAWDLYLKAAHVFGKRSPSDHKDTALETSRRYLEEAIKLDNSMAAAYSLLAEICVAELLSFTTKDSKKTLAEILENGKKAAELDPKDPVAAESIAQHYFHSGFFDQAKQYAERAIKLNPSLPDAYNRMGQSMVHSGSYAESKQYFEKAIALNPLSSQAIMYKLGLFFADMGLGNYSSANLLIDECIEHSPKAGHYRGFKASVLGHLGLDEDADKALKFYLSLRPNLKQRGDYKKIFVKNSALADTLIEGLIKAGWEAES